MRAERFDYESVGYCPDYGLGGINTSRRIAPLARGIINTGSDSFPRTGRDVQRLHGIDAKIVGEYFV